MKSKDLRGTWPQALVGFFFPLLLVLAVRFFLIEPFVIPSGSMIPQLLVHDHIFVNKIRFGIKNPFQNQWLLTWAKPESGDILVFRYPKNPGIFYVKRLIAGPGQEVEIKAGEVFVDGISLGLEAVPPMSMDEEFQYFRESGRYMVRYIDAKASQFSKTKVPEGFYFFLGDNRDQSSDSRFWGFVPEDNLVGKPFLIWLSCEQTLQGSGILCDPLTLRRGRILKRIGN